MKVLSAALLPSLAAAFCHHGTSLWSRSTASFGYEGEISPLAWAALDPAYEACAKGKNQSPANLVVGSKIKQVSGTSVALTLPALDDGAELENLGTTLEVVMEGKGASITYDGVTASLLQFHFHAPSEHHVNGEHYPMEAHFVFEDGGALIVMGVLIEVDSSDDALISSVFEDVAAVASSGSTTHTGALDFDGLKAHVSASQVWTYGGSLTTPPCSEVVTWLVVNSPITISPPTYREVRKILGFNARYTQNTPGSTNLLEHANKEIFGDDDDDDNDSDSD